MTIGMGNEWDPGDPPEIHAESTNIALIGRMVRKPGKYGLFIECHLGRPHGLQSEVQSNGSVHLPPQAEGLEGSDALPPVRDGAAQGRKPRKAMASQNSGHMGAARAAKKGATK